MPKVRDVEDTPLNNLVVEQPGSHSFELNVRIFESRPQIERVFLVMLLNLLLRDLGQELNELGVLIVDGCVSVVLPLDLIEQHV